MAESASRKADPETAALEAAVDQAIAACDGDIRAAVRALVVSIDFHEAELQALREEVATLTAAVSRGYARSKSYASRTVTGKGTSEPPPSV